MGYESNLNESVGVLKGIGPKRIDCLERIGIRTLEDLVGHYPREYQDRRNISRIADADIDNDVLIKGRIQLVVPGRHIPGKKSNLRIMITDDSGSMEAVFFNANYLSKLIRPGMICSVFGRLTENNGRQQMLHPDITLGDSGNDSGIIPVYPLTSGISQNDMRKWIRQAMETAGPFTEYLPQDLLDRNRLCSIDHAISNIHFPVDPQKYQEAKFRLIFEELMYLQTGLMASKKRNVQFGRGISFSSEFRTSDFTARLPFQLTDAQNKVIKAIENDMESSGKMNRLVQGDVGSGKTIVAAAAIYKAVKSGYQAAMMAPTELLARQHLATLGRIFSGFGFRVGLLVSGISASEKKKVLKDLEDGRIDVVVGTHAVIQPGVGFNRLGLVITDEQHRFGVRQRSMLADKGETPDVLVMTATPIPRTLAVILYGDLDISVIDEMPRGRKKIITKAVSKKERDLAYEFVRTQLSQGRQAYVVAPLIEDSEEMDVQSAGSLFRELRKKMMPYRATLLHGEMKQNEKEEAMNGFVEGRTDVLVSTVVIEVGIDVTNATVIIIENAERFGLAQLHQLRGRVGRGSEQSYCILITDANEGVSGERISVMTETDNGFIIAEKDLSLRGPGEFFGTKQHGVPELKLADLSRHIKVLELVRNEAADLLEKDALLEKTENSGIKKKINNMFSGIENFNL